MTEKEVNTYEKLLEWEDTEEESLIVKINSEEYNNKFKELMNSLLLPSDKKEGNNEH